MVSSTSGLSWVTDNAGVAVIDAPELLGKEVWLHLSSHGYDVPKDGFGYRGIQLTLNKGGSKTVRLHRQLAAERVGRLTGSGLVAESQKIGLFPTWKESGVVGCDSVHVTPWKGKLFWLWGDTNVFHYPLGIFKTLGASSDINPIDPEHLPILPKLDFFRDDSNQLKSIADIAGKGPVWLGGLVSLPDQHGEEHLVASYAKIQNHLDVEEFGLCEWDDDAQVFRQVKPIWRSGVDSPSKAKDVVIPDGHAVRYRDDAGVENILFVNPSPQVQIPATYESWIDPSSWKAIPRLRSLSDSTGQKIELHRGDIAWCSRINKWVMVFTQFNGKESKLGEIWITTSETPLRDWAPPIRIVTHTNYTFYNPMIHSHWLSKDSPWLYLEGTYTAEFADRAEKTPRFDYNQILYRVDLDSMQ